MRSYRFKKFGVPAAEALARVDETIPTPGRGEVLVRVRASSLNFRDLIIQGGQFPWPVAPGRVPVSDAAGEVEAVGEGVSRFKVGERVLNAFYPNWFGGPFNAMPEQWVVDQDGWLTEYKVVSAEVLTAIPEHLSFEEAAALPCTSVAAWSALAGVGPGDVV